MSDQTYRGQYGSVHDFDIPLCELAWDVDICQDVASAIRVTLASLGDVGFLSPEVTARLTMASADLDLRVAMAQRIPEE